MCGYARRSSPRRLAALLQARDLDLLQQGEESAAALGLDIEASKRILAMTAAVLTGASIAVAGMIGFVGLVVPHAVRLVVGPANRRLLPAADCRERRFSSSAT